MQTPVEINYLSVTQDSTILPKEILVTIFNGVSYQEQAKLARLNKAYCLFFQDKQFALTQHKSNFFCISRPLNNLLFCITKFDRTGMGPGDESHCLHIYITNDLKQETTYIIPKQKAQNLFDILNNEKDDIKCLTSLLGFFRAEGCRKPIFKIFFERPSVTREPTSVIIKKLIEKELAQPKIEIPTHCDSKDSSCSYLYPESKPIEVTDVTGIPAHNKNLKLRRL